MNISITPKPYTLESLDYWTSKVNGIIFVNKEEDIEKLYNLLVEKDNYWKSYKSMIKVLPSEINSESELQDMCKYTGKTDVYDLYELRKYVDFFIYQYREITETRVIVLENY